MRAALLALVLVVFAAGCGSGDGDDDDRGSGVGCRGRVRERRGAGLPARPETREAPTEPLDTATTYALVVETNCGSFTIALDLEAAPNTSASLVALASDGYFDDTIFHRVVPGFVIQGGDPTAVGRRRARLQTVDAPPPDARYVKGVVAMAKTEPDPPGTSGSQFFVVTGADIGLPADYAIVGEVTEGSTTVELDRRARPGRRAADAAGRDRDRHRRREADGLTCRRRSSSPPARRRASARPSSGSSCLRSSTASRARRWTRSSSSRARTSSSCLVTTCYKGLRSARRVRRVERGPGASLRCGLAALGEDVEAAVVVLADGPALSPDCRRSASSPPGASGGGVVAASYEGAAATRSCSAARTGETSRTKAFATARCDSCRATTSARRATSTAGGSPG